MSVVILAAGRGSRMRARFKDLPKVLVPVAGRSMIRRIVESVLESEVFREIVVVVAPDSKAAIEKELSNLPIVTAVQSHPLGTGNAVLAAKERATSKTTLILCGDQPLISSRSLLTLVTAHEAGSADVTMLTVVLEDFMGRRSAFRDWGRIIRNASGEVAKIIEARDISGNANRVLEVNPGIYCVCSSFLWSALGALEPRNSQGEYQLTDLIETAVSSSRQVETVQASDPFELIGANDSSQLDLLQTVVEERAVKLNHRDSRSS